ncbi:RNA-binding domain-containing protein [Desulfitobacterium hafniense]|nr:RNA-binding domain-containing protein [Desulfitobacterium hafniense]ACL22698.1 putative transcriptional regulator [Desulfitobacterium hafniense DCB-2]KTE93638.1 AAA family ATPase [Desulfitobacterium hafniense]
MKRSEDATTEFKRDYVDDIKKTVIAFANTSGGTLYIGIDDSGQAVGIGDVDNTLLRVSNAIRDTIKPDVTLFVSYEVQMVDNRHIIKITVQKGTASPYYLANKGIRPQGVYIRQGPSSVPATEATILNMIKNTDGENYEDVRSLQQELTFSEAEKAFSSGKIPFGTSQQKTLKITNADGIYTNLGLLLSDQCRHTIRLAVFEGTTKSVFKDRREFSGSLLKQLNEVYETISHYNRTRAEFDGLYRIDRRDYPVEAIREALLNALVHRDYSFSASTLISIFDDRLEFVSIGGLLKGISHDDIMLGISVTRNENLAHIFYRLTLIEAYGTGMPKIMQSYQGYPVAPLIEITDNAFKITLPNLNSNYGVVKEAAPLYGNELMVVEMLKTNESITRKEVEGKLSLSQAAAVNLLKRLVIRGLIRPVGAGKNTRYIRA